MAQHTSRFQLPAPAHKIHPPTPPDNALRDRNGFNRENSYTPDTPSANRLHFWPFEPFFSPSHFATKVDPHEPLIRLNVILRAPRRIVPGSPTRELPAAIPVHIPLAEACLPSWGSTAQFPPQPGTLPGANLPSCQTKTPSPSTRKTSSSS